MRRSRLLVCCSALLISVATFPCLAEMDYDVNFLLGGKTLDEDDWAPLEQQSEFGVSATFGHDDWPVRIALDLLASADDNALFEVTTSELDIGVRKVWHRSNATPFVGGGLALVGGEIEDRFVGNSIDDEGTGAWIDGGAFWRLGRRFNLGVEARLSRGEVTLGGADIEAGGSHLALILGFGKSRD